MKFKPYDIIGNKKYVYVILPGDMIRCIFRPIEYSTIGEISFFYTEIFDDFLITDIFREEE